jgi:hypothetical protein
MTYPAAPNFRFGDPGSAWWIVQTPSGPRVTITQWDVVLRMFQDKAKNHFLPAIYGRSTSGRCPATTERTWGDVWGALSANARARADITVDGLWHDDTADILWTLMCMTHQTTRAEEWALAANEHAITHEAVRQIIWFAFYVDALDPDPTATTPWHSSVDGNNLVLPDNAVLPLWQSAPQSMRDDSTWSANFKPGIDSLPLSPSQAAVAARPPVRAIQTVTQMRVSVPVTLGILAVLGGMAWWLSGPSTPGARV